MENIPVLRRVKCHACEMEIQFNVKPEQQGTSLLVRCPCQAINRVSIPSVPSEPEPIFDPNNLNDVFRLFYRSSFKK